MKDERQRAHDLVTTIRHAFSADRDDVRLVRAPLRICPLGAHIDHQLGLVTGMTINAPILLAYVPNPMRQVRIHSLNFSPPVAFSLDDVPPSGDPLWGNYVQGAALALLQRYALHCGVDGVIAGDMPIGGLSSSAAVGVAYLLALEDVNDLEVTPVENVELDRYIENEYIGLNNGILDQSVILLSDRRHLTFLDCQSVDFSRIPSPLDQDDFEIVVVYSGLTQALVSTDYNRRVSQCQMAARMLLERAGRRVAASPCLRMVPPEVFWDHQRHLPEPLAKRARHFFTEMERVRQGVAAWEAGDLTRFGELMAQSGHSSIVNYECGSPHLISLYEILSNCPGVYGARFSGAGFRGCCIGLSDPAQRGTIVETIHREYPTRHPDIKGEYGIYFCKPDGPARRVPLPE
ncbi:MAG: galactokinase family protein [Anaerolineae bacterium]